MRQLNYNHLLYFWEVARRGSIVEASRTLHITPQTISGQIKLLEDSVGEPLFRKDGRRLILTSVGRLAQQYANEIFELGAELASCISSKQLTGRTRLNIGIDQSMPKLIACRVTTSLYDTNNAISVNYIEGNQEYLLSELSIHNVDLILTTQPMPHGLSVKAYTHVLGSSSMTFYATSKVKQTLNGKFPDCLNYAPLLVPGKTNPLRSSIEMWFEGHEINPIIVGEYDDSGLMKTFGWAHVGLFLAPTLIKSEIESTYRVKAIGTVPDITEKYYAISPERKIKHPAVLEICEHAHEHIFSFNG